MQQAGWCSRQKLYTMFPLPDITCIFLSTFSPPGKFQVGVFYNSRRTSAFLARTNDSFVADECGCVDTYIYIQYILVCLCVLVIIPGSDCYFSDRGIPWTDCTRICERNNSIGGQLPACPASLRSSGHGQLRPQLHDDSTTIRDL